MNAVWGRFGKDPGPQCHSHQGRGRDQKVVGLDHLSDPHVHLQRGEPSGLILYRLDRETPLALGKVTQRLEGAPDHWSVRCDSAGSRFPPWHHSSDLAASAAQHQEAGDHATGACSVSPSA